MCTETKDTVFIRDHAHCGAAGIFGKAAQLRINFHACCAGECLGHNREFGLALNTTLNVLPVAATATFGHMWARRNATVGRWFDDGHQLSATKVLLFLRQRDLDKFASEHARNEDNTAICKAGDAIAAGDQFFYTYLMG
jgi:hypothetical protein